MLAELRIRDLAVIADLELVLPAGMTAVTGETGAGKTMLVEAIELLVGGRSDGVLVRAGASEAWVEGRFVDRDHEVVLARAVPAGGRSRAYLDGRMAPVAALAQAGAGLVDLHGQHSHQSLLAGPVQRAALDAFAGVDLTPLGAARERLRRIDAELAALGGDEASRTREVELLRHQVADIDAAALTGPDEDAELEAEEERLADASGHREAAARAHAVLTAEGGALDALGTALAALARRAPLAPWEGRLRALSAEAGDVAAELRAAADELEDDPERLAEVRSRRRLLWDLQRKYAPGPGGRPGPGALAEVLAEAEQARQRLARLEGLAGEVAHLEESRAAAMAALRRAEGEVGATRRRAAPEMAAAVEAHLRELAMPGGRFEVQVGEDDAGEQVAFLLGANPGEPVLPLSKVASGGELARTMLAVRLVVAASLPAGAPTPPASPLPAGAPTPPGRRAGAPPAGALPTTMVFDEVDAGLGGQAALAVGRALAALAGDEGGPHDRQVLVVTHLPQVAAFADQQVAVHKVEREGRTVAEARVVEGGARVVELSRMLSGQPESGAARRHAEELLAAVARERGS